MSSGGYKILVTGASGFLGSRIVEELLSTDSLIKPDKLRVLDLRRYEGRSDPRLEIMVGDIRDKELVNKACSDVDGVIHCAALVDWGAFKPKDVEEINLGGTQNVLDACRQNGVTALVSTSTVDAVYTGKPLSNIDERVSYPQIYSNMYGQSKSEAEQLVISNNHSHLMTAVIRPADIWGEGDPYHLKALFKMARTGPYVRLGNGKSRCQHVYVGNCAHGHIMLLQSLLDKNENVGGQVYFITDGPGENFFSFFDRIVLGSGVKVWPKNLWLPRWLAYGIGALSETLALLWRPIKYYNPTFSRFAVQYTCTDMTFTSEKAIQHFGFAVKYPVTEAIEKTAHYYSQKLR